MLPVRHGFHQRIMQGIQAEIRVMQRPGLRRIKPRRGQGDVHRPGHLAGGGAFLRHGEAPRGPPVPGRPARDPTQRLLEHITARPSPLPMGPRCHTPSSFRMPHKVPRIVCLPRQEAISVGCERVTVMAGALRTCTGGLPPGSINHPPRQRSGARRLRRHRARGTCCTPSAQCIRHGGRSPLYSITVRIRVPDEAGEGRCGGRPSPASPCQRACPGHDVRARQVSRLCEIQMVEKPADGESRGHRLLAWVI